MPRNSTLKAVRQMVQAELGSVVGVPTQVDALINRRVLQTQLWLATEVEWAFLRGRQDIVVDADTRFVDIPQMLNTEQVPTAYVRSPDNTANSWFQLEYGITPVQLNQYDYTPEPQTSDVPRRWQFSLDNPAIVSQPGTQQIELWPVPAIQVRVRLVGQHQLRSLPSQLKDQPNLVLPDGNSTGDDALVLDLDDLLLAYNVAASMQTANKELSANLAARALRRFNKLKAANTNAQPTFTLGKTREIARPVNLKFSDEN